MSTVTLDSLRWRDPPAQATVTTGGGPARVHLQVIAPREVAAMCRGRPVEELPRILSILSPAHHLCAAQVLDRLFAVDPPPVARNVREALRLALVFRHHLRKFHFLASSGERPFAEFWPEGARRGPDGLRPLLDDLVRHVSAAQEAAAILGARADHPVTAVAGGVSRALKPEHQVRLGEIAVACRSCAERVAVFLRERVLARGELLGDVRTLDAGPLASLALAAAGDAVVLRDGRGAEVERPAIPELLEAIGLHEERWSHEPFAYRKAAGWKDAGPAGAESLFFVGPLARLAEGEPLPTPLAEAERGRLVQALGPFPRLEVAAAWWALAVELLAAAEGLVALCDPEKLSGPAPRTIPKGAGPEGYAALESPQGLIWQHVRADERGVVEEVRVLDTAAANNALLGIVAQRAVEASLARGQGWDEAKKTMELALLAF